MPTFLALLGMFISVLLIGIILLQRGRGGGLVGALSGLGGQSAFGTKAGDMFTRITIGIAAVWVLLAGIHGQVLRARTEKFKNETAETEINSTSKDKDNGSAKSDDSKIESGLGSSSSELKDAGAKDEIRTRDPDLGKVVLYQLSYFRIFGKCSVGTMRCKYMQKSYSGNYFLFFLQ